MTAPSRGSGQRCSVAATEKARIASADGGTIAVVSTDCDENGLRPSLRSCTHHGRAPQRVPRLEMHDDRWVIPERIPGSGLL